MNKYSLYFSFHFCLVTFSYGIPAFIGAEGWGAETVGGRGGTVYIVNTLASSGPGSFLNALQQKEPRIIVFAVSGVITLTPPSNGFEPNGDYSYVTIAGQTSPGGITLTGSMNPGGSIWWCYSGCQDTSFHDAVIRFIRFRANSSNEDAITLTHSHNFIFDHCDFSGGSDETQDLTYNHHFTVQWSTIANSSAGQTYGSLIAYPPTSHISLHHNIWAHHLGRGGPHMHWQDKTPPEGGLIDYRNNICYDANDYLYWSAYKNDLYVNFVGNYFKAGPGTTGDVGRPVYLASGTPKPYLLDNIWINQFNQSLTNPASIFGNSLITSGNVVTTPYAMPLVTTLSKEKSYTKVMQWCGAFPRDSMNRRTIKDIKHSSGVMKKDNDPLIQTGPQAPEDSDQDGMPDFWEKAMGLNPTNANDNNGDHDKDGYTNIEEYLNDLALARVCEDYFNPVYPIPASWPDFDTSCCSYIPVSISSFKPNIRRIASFYYYRDSKNRLVFTSSTQHTQSNNSVQIYSIQGRLLSSFPILGKATWNCSQFPKGIYFAKLKSTNESLSLLIK